VPNDPTNSTGLRCAGRRSFILWQLAAAAALLLSGGTAGAEMYGGIEIGAKGIKAIVLDVAPERAGVDPVVKFSDTTNLGLVAGIAQTGQVDARTLDEAAATVARYSDRMKTEFRVKPEHVYIVGSSGLFSPLAGKDDRIRANQQAIAAAIRQATGAAMDFIDPRREVELSIKGALPPKDWDQAVLFDVGSGNTKGGYVGADRQITSVSVPFGTVSFTELVRKAGPPFAEQARQLRDRKFAPALRKELARVSEMNARLRVYLSGGIVWAAATLTHPEETGPFTALFLPDLDELQKRIAADPGKFPAPDLANLVDEAKRSRAREEIRKVQGTYTPEQLLAGTQLLQALATELHLEAGGKQVFFARNGYLAWILAYIREKDAQGPERRRQE
jgi:exopolyphosphatase/pppGpp-phosphohydrolase